MPFPVRALAFAGAALLIAGSAEADSLTLNLGEMRREPAPGVVANVEVVDPGIADVSVIDQHSVIIIGKGPGVTEILATDHAGRVLIDDHVMVSGPRDDGHVTIYRGLKGEDYACLPRCPARDESGNGPAPAAGAAAPAESTSNTIVAPPTPPLVPPAPLHP